MEASYFDIQFIYILLMAACVILCLVPEIVRFVRHKKVTKKLTVGRVIIIGTAGLFLVNLSGFDLHPKLKLLLYVILLCVSTYIALSAVRDKAVAIILGLIIVLFSLFWLSMMNPAVEDRTVDGEEYVCVWSKWTGISETHVYGFERKMFVFIKSRPAFMENYGIVLDSPDSISERVPYETYFYD